MFNVKFILILLNINGIGNRTINNLIKCQLPCSLESISILNFLDSCRSDIKRIPKVTLDQIIDAKNKCENIILKCQNENINIISILDDKFPKKLKIINNNPVIIYYKGNIDCINNNKSMAVIGSRGPTMEGINIAYKLGKYLSKRGFIVVSGLALGCDTFVHEGCLSSKGQTVAVMPCGLDIIYPKTNEKLFKNIIHNEGCIISEYAPNQKTYKNQFIERDRLQSALSAGIIVVEASINSGSMYTVNFALKQNKIVGCCTHTQKNMHLLKNKNIYNIQDEKSLESFILNVEAKINDINKKAKYEEYTQITFTV